MPEKDLAVWKAARGYDAHGVPKDAELLSEKLLRSCLTGDAARVEELLALGAKPNSRLASHSNKGATMVALSAGHDAIALRLLEACGWGGSVGRSRPGGAVDVVDPWDNRLGSGASEVKKLGDLALSILKAFAKARSWQSLSKARDLCDPAMSDDRLLGLAFEAASVPLALQASRLGIHPSSACWKDSIEAFARDRVQHLSLHVDHGVAIPSLCEWLSEPKNVKGASSSAISRLFGTVLEKGDVELMGALLDAGLSPGGDWLVARKVYSHKAGGYFEVKSSMLWHAAKKPESEMFTMLLGAPSVVDAAKRHQEPPYSMAEVLVSHIVAMADLGVSVDHVDASGAGLAHAWAAVDREPRSGWATLMKKMPKIFDQRNAAGKTGSDLMAEKLGSKAKEKFLSELAKRESREIKAVAGKAPAPVAAAKRRL